MKSKQQTTEIEQQSDEFCNEFTQTTSDIVHSKRRIECFFFLRLKEEFCCCFFSSSLEVFRASRMLAPISASTHHDSSTIRHQSTRLPLKLRKSHENDLNQHKITRKDDDHTQTKHVPSPNPPQEEKVNIDRSSKIIIFYYRNTRINFR
jgi:hypothetical protein